ncbi:MAG: hypothetical protein AAFR75_00440 [Pseudomonadota bacterium]
MQTVLRTLVPLLLLSLSTHTDAQTPFPDPESTGSGALILSIWDPNLGTSLLYAIPNETYQSIQRNRPDLDGFSIEIPDFASTFIESNTADLRYTLFAAGTSSGSDAAGPAFYVTRDTPQFFRTVTNEQAGLTYDNALVFNANLAAACPTPTCIAFSSEDPVYAGQPDWGDLSATLPFDASGALGDSLFFFQITQLNRGEFARGRDVRGTGGFDLLWTLDDTGTLSASSTVPLPSSLLLLLSGFAGVWSSRRGRRR